MLAMPRSAQTSKNKKIHKSFKKCQKKTSKAKINRKDHVSQGPKAQREEQTLHSQFQIFESCSLYTLEAMNSISYDNGMIYDMFKIKKQPQSRKITKCRCRKSQCAARYCECFANGQACSNECTCDNCRNTEFSKRPELSCKKRKGCSCSKSQCQKKYCDCFQRGLMCSDHCQCSGCQNC